MLNASSIRFRQLIDVSDWRHRIPQWGHKQFWIWIRIKYFFYPSLHFQAIVSSKSLILKRNSALVYSFIFFQNFAILIFHWYFWMLYLSLFELSNQICLIYLIQIVCFDTLTLLSSWFFVIYLLLNGKTLGGNEFCNQHHYSFIKPYFQHFLILYLTCIRISHWHRLATEGGEFWISCKWLKLLRKAGRLQLIQNAAFSVARQRQCDIRIVEKL